jgi:superfamily II DNA or RNA helicase
MNLQLANFQDLLATYYYGTAAHKVAKRLGDWIRHNEEARLATLLRDYREKEITSSREIGLRAATDRLMNCCSVMEIASLAGFVQGLQRTDFGMGMRIILENKHVRQYYEHSYPTKLPQLFRCRLKGTNQATERVDPSESHVSILSFLDLDRHFMENLEDGFFLRMVDSFWIEGYGFSDMVALISNPEELTRRLLLAPEERDVLSTALNEFSLFMEFCFDLERLLSNIESKPLLQSAMWNHYSYWFDIIGDELNEQLGLALSQFLEWKAKTGDMNSAGAVQTYVSKARAVLETLTSRRFAEPVDVLLGAVSRSEREIRMHETDIEEEIPFSSGDWVVDRNNPAQAGQYTGNWRRAGPHLMVQLSYPGGGTSFRPLASLEAMLGSTHRTIDERLLDGHFGRVRDLQRLITYEKLKGTLHEVIYSMEAAQIDFYPYQFKSVLKFINSPTERLIIADEVGLGKTIESALIWTEVQARRQAERLLVVCPKTLAEKWQEELRGKFLLDARVVGFSELQKQIKELKKMGPGQPFVLIATYTGLRPPKAELRLLDEPPDVEPTGSPRTFFLREIRHWDLGYEPFDMVIFDEAHYMRNPATTTFHLGESLAASAGAVLCVSATPVNNSNTDLHSLLRLIDESFFETQGMFEELLKANRPAVLAGNALAKIPVDMPLLAKGAKGMGESPFISQSPLFQQFLEKVEHLDISDKAQLAKCQDLAEKLNLLGSYVNRTRRVQVKENRPLRDPLILQVEYSTEEMLLYQTILDIVRRRCILDGRPFHVFQVIGLQLRSASCLPVMAQEIRNGKFGDPEELYNGAIGEDVIDDLFDEDFKEDLEHSAIAELLTYDFERNDSKYKALRRMLLDLVPDEKVVIFAYYRPTLDYLRHRLIADGANVGVIHGGVRMERRWVELDKFKDPRGSRVLLSSEVGSEGIDLQFCRVIVNYDLPWNPMRVEQRIGRIDRVGQVAKRLSIVNFKVKDTIEERLYDRLHSKLERFANSLGDLEAVIGKEVQQLTVELLSKQLTQEEEARLMDLSEAVIEKRLIEVQALEESGDALIALSDYVQRKIEEDREKGRYIRPEELEFYLTDFFEREFQGCELIHNTPVDGCIQVKLTFTAHSSLSSFIRDDRSIIARPLRKKEFTITFRTEVMQRLPANQRRSVHFVNHLSPLIRWITQINLERSHGFYDVSAIQITHPELPEGDYCYRIERWKFKGLSTREHLAYGLGALSDGRSYAADAAEDVIQHLLRNGRDWDYAQCDKEALLHVHRNLVNGLAEQFSSGIVDFEAENTTAYQIKVHRVESFFDRRIAQDEQRIRTLREAGRDPRVIRASEGRLQTAIMNKAQRLAELKEKARVDMEQTQVAAGIFRVTGT